MAVEDANFLDGAIQVGKYISLFASWGVGLFGLHTWAYNRFPKYYFKVIGIFSKYRDTKWSISVNYKREELGDFYPAFESLLKGRFGKFSRPVNLKNKKLYECGVYNILVTDDFDLGEHSTKTIWLKISQLNVTIKSADHRLIELRTLFNQVEREIRDLDPSYGMEISFPNRVNPFFGLMVQRLGVEKIDHFECFFDFESLINTTPNDVGGEKKKYFLRVFKEKLCINDGSFDTIEEIAKRALLIK